MGTSGAAWKEKEFFFSRKIVWGLAINKTCSLLNLLCIVHCRFRLVLLEEGQSITTYNVHLICHAGIEMLEERLVTRTTSPTK